MATTMLLDADDTDKTAEPAAKRILGADFEPGPSSPLTDDGSPKWNAAKAAGRFATQVIANERAEAAKRREASLAVWWPHGPEGDER
jgi:hypothetical protein